MFEELLNEYDINSDFDYLCELAISNLHIIEEHTTIVKHHIELNTWDDLAAMSLLLYISVDMPYDCKEWLYRICSQSFRNSSLFNCAICDDLYHASIINKDGSCNHSHLNKNGFMSVADYTGVESFMRNFSPAHMLLYKVEGKQCTGSIQISKFLQTNQWVQTHARPKKSLLSRVDSEHETIVLFDDVKAVLPTRNIVDQSNYFYFQ